MLSFVRVNIPEPEWIHFGMERNGSEGNTYVGRKSKLPSSRVATLAGVASNKMIAFGGKFAKQSTIACLVCSETFDQRGLRNDLLVCRLQCVDAII